jgi:hypothetical protein
MLGHLSAAGVEASVAGKKLGEAWSTYSLKQKSSSDEVLMPAHRWRRPSLVTVF